MKEEKSPNIEIMIANEAHYGYVDLILETVAKAAKARGTGTTTLSRPHINNRFPNQLSSTLYYFTNTNNKINPYQYAAVALHGLDDLA